jgi:hypothetical protein
MLNQPSLVILIDYWQRMLPRFWVDDTITFLNTTDTIKTVVLATYNSRSELFFQPKSIWHRNRKEWYEKASTWANDMSILEYKRGITYNKDNNYKNSQTDSEILEYCNPSQHQIAMLQFWEIEYYLSLRPEIKNIYVLGSLWELCVRNRPIGYLALSKLQNVNILTHNKLVRAKGSKYPDLSNNPHWIKVEGNVYKYLGNEKVDD